MGVRVVFIGGSVNVNGRIHGNKWQNFIFLRRRLDRSMAPYIYRAKKGKLLAVLIHAQKKPKFRFK